MFNSFLDGSKPSIECTAVANATGLAVPSNGLRYPPASVEDIPYVTRPISEGGVLERKGMVEVISSLETDGRPIPYDIRMGVWVTVEAETEYIKNCFEEYNAHTDPSGRYFTLYKRWHLIGLEVGLSVASVALRGEATGVATGWNADVVATAKRDLQPGDVLDGEGGYTVWGRLLPAQKSAAIGGVPLGLAHDVKVVRAVRTGRVPDLGRRRDGHHFAGVHRAPRDGADVRGMKICVVGAGAIGGFIGTRLALAGAHEVSALARGATLAALRQHGWRLRQGGALRSAPARAAQRRRRARRAGPGGDRRQGPVAARGGADDRAAAGRAHAGAAGDERRAVVVRPRRAGAAGAGRWPASTPVASSARRCRSSRVDRLRRARQHLDLRARAGRTQHGPGPDRRRAGGRRIDARARAGRHAARRRLRRHACRPTCGATSGTSCGAT